MFILTTVFARTLALMFAFFCLSIAAIAQNSSVPKGWKQVTACEFSFLLPDDALQRKTHPVDSCLAGFDTKDIHIGLDYGLYSGPGSQQEWEKNYRNLPVKINGRKASLITYEIDERNPEFPCITMIHMWTSEPSMETGPGVSILMVISSKRSVEPRIVKQIYESLKFVGK